MEITYICSGCGEVESFNSGMCPLCGSRFKQKIEIVNIRLEEREKLNMVKLPLDSKSYAEYVNNMRKCSQNDDGEQAHRDADFLLVDFLKEIGCSELATAFLDVERWYS